MNKLAQLVLTMIFIFTLIASCQSINMPVIPPTAPVKFTQASELDKLPPQVVSFPGAEGFGAKTVGGRKGKVLEVINLNDSGPGSLRAAIDAIDPRIVVFRVAGTIELKSSLNIMNPYITIAGQTAPGGGITLKNHPTNMDGTLIVETHDVIIRYIRSRPGAPNVKSDNGDAIEINGSGAYNVIIDHCSFSWAIDEVVSTWYDAHDITIQWSIISEGLNCSNHVKGCHSMGLLVGSEGARNITVHHNLLSSNHERNPLIETDGLVDVVNNVIYNSWGTPALVSNAYGKVSANFVANYMKFGPDSDAGKYFVSVEVVNDDKPELFVEGNIAPRRPTDDLDQTLVVKPDSRDSVVAIKFESPAISTESASEAYEKVLAEAGASIGLDNEGGKFNRQDSVDKRIVNEVKNGGGKIIDDPSQVGGWPQLSPGTPPIDTDHDGMPDIWEEQFGLNLSDPTDGPMDADGDGYTNIEEYLNATNPMN